MSADRCHDIVLVLEMIVVPCVLYIKLPMPCISGLLLHDVVTKRSLLLIVISLKARNKENHESDRSILC